MASRPTKKRPLTLSAARSRGCELSAGELAEALDLCHDDPILFNRLVLRREPYWWRQEEICRDVVDFKTTVVATGNAIGKSYLAAGIGLWWLYTRPGSQLVATAPSQTLLGTVLFKEMRRALRWARKMGVPLPGRITDSASVSPQLLDVDGTGWMVLGIATTGVERLSGQHAHELFHLGDECSGLRDEVWEALHSQSAMKSLFLGNPLNIEGRFFSLFERGRHERYDESIESWKRCVSLSIPSTDSIHCDLDRSPWGLADKTFLEESEREWGKESLWWLTHIAAEFPKSSFAMLIEPEWVDRCASFQRTEPTHWPSVCISIDPAAGVNRDRTVILVRDRYGILELDDSARMKLPETARRSAELARKWRVPQERIVFDANGIGRDLPLEWQIYGITKAQTYFGMESGGPRFANNRTRCAWALRQRLNPDARRPGMLEHETKPGHVRRHGLPISVQAQALPVKQIAFHIPAERWFWSMSAELKQLKYRNVDMKRIGLEKKEDYAARLGRSPDLADALIMSFSLEDPD